MILNEWQCAGPSMSAHDGSKAVLAGVVVTAAQDGESACVTGVVSELHTGDPFAVLTAISCTHAPWLYEIFNGANRGGGLGNVASHNKATHS